MNTFKRLTLWFVLAAIILGPTATGIFPIFPAIVIQTALFLAGHQVMANLINQALSHSNTQLSTTVRTKQ
jgi:hypothetical protein